MKNRAIICLGMSLCLLVGMFVLWGGLPLAEATGLDISNILKYWSIPLVLAIGAALFLTLLKKRLPAKAFLSGAALFAGVALLCGFALLLLCGKLEDLNIALVCGSAALMGFGYSTLLILWQHHLAQLSRNGVTKALLLSLIIGSAGYLLLDVFLGSRAWYVFPAIVVMVIVLCLLAVHVPALRTDTMHPLKSRREMIKKTVVQLRDPLFCVSAIAFAVALTRAMALDGLEDAGIVNIVASFCVIVVALLLYLVWFKLKYNHPLFAKLNIPGLYRVSFPLIATALLALSLVGSTLSLAVTTLVYVVFALVSAFIMSTSIDLARKYQIWSSYVYGVFAGVVYLVFAVATALGAWVYYPKNFGAATFSIIVLVVLYILAMTYVAIKNRRRKDEEERQQKEEHPPQANDANTSPIPATSRGEAAVVDEVAQRCIILAEQNKLTVRESETLLLLAKGRDVPSISKQLFISENTVRSHSKGVYRKLNIHSKQELLDLLETVHL